MPTIRPLQARDWPATWAILEPIFRAGDSYCVASDITEADARRYWVESPQATFVANDAGGHVMGSYYIKPNQPGPGAHVCNCGYVVDPNVRGLGVASAMCEHSQDEARARGFTAMQYNFVVATNTGAIRLWRGHGFDVVGTLPDAFRHPVEGLVDAYVMYKLLND